MDYVREKFEKQCKKLGLPKKDLKANVTYFTDYAEVDARLYKQGGTGLAFMNDMFEELKSRFKPGEELVSMAMNCVFGDTKNKVRFIASVYRPADSESK